MDEETDWSGYDDGWRECELCHEGFTDFEETPPTCGYHAKTDLTLCEECFEKVETMVLERVKAGAIWNELKKAFGTDKEEK